MDTTIVTGANAQALQEIIPDQNIKNRLEKFEDTLLDTVGKSLDTLGQKKAVTATVSLTLFLASCAPVIKPVIPVGDVPTQKSQSTEVAQTATVTTTETPTQTPTAAPTSTPEFSPDQQLEILKAEGDLEKLGEDPNEYVFINIKGDLKGTDSEGNEIYKDGGFTLHFAVEILQKNLNLAKVNYAPKISSSRKQFIVTNAILNNYLWPLEYKMIDKYNSENPSTLIDQYDLDQLKPMCLNPGTNSWGVIIGANDKTFLVFEKAGGEIDWISLQPVDGGFVIYYVTAHAHVKCH